MPQVSRTVLKSYFETGDIPTQAQFIDLIDSVLNFFNDGNPVISKHSGIVLKSTTAVISTTISDIFTIPANELSVDGQMLEFDAWGVMSTEIFTRNFTINMQGIDYNIQFPSLPAGVKSWHLKGTLTRFDANTAILSYSVTTSTSTVAINEGTTAMFIDNAIVYDFSLADAISIKAQAFTGGSITFHNWRINKIVV